MNETRSMNPLTFDPGKNPVLYHYCSTDTFLSIVQNRCIWMSDINTMNDFGELHWAYDKFISAANLVLDMVGREFVEKIDQVVSTAQLYNLPMLCSLSTDGDVLSQWRAYANDGEGISIGFDAAKLSSLSVRIGPICYDEGAQLNHFKVMLLAMHDVYSELPDGEKPDFLMEQVPIFANEMGLFKNPGFAEEKEVRLIRSVIVKREKALWGLEDVGGTGEEASSKPLQVSYRASRNGGIVSYIALPLEGLGNDLIKEVVIGPKNPCNGVEVAMALSAQGFQDTKIRQSKSTYR